VPLHAGSCAPVGIGQGVATRVDPLGLATDDELCAHPFGDQFSDGREYETYLGAFTEGAIERWRELAPQVEADNPVTKDTKYYLPDLGLCLASAATEVRAITEQPSDPSDSTRHSPP
jgi:hypothetical protein